MSTTNNERTLDYVPITGRGVDALDRRKEHNSSRQETASLLRKSIDKVKQGIFSGIKMLTAGALHRIQKQ